MKIIQKDSDNNVVLIADALENTIIEDLRIVTTIPSYTPRDGYLGVLKYDDIMGIYWDYIEIVPIEDPNISPEEFQQMIEEVL